MMMIRRDTVVPTTQEFASAQQPHSTTASASVVRPLTRTRKPRKRLLRVLIIDDDHDTVDTLAKLSRIWGHNVRLAYDGSVGIQLAMDARPDVLLLDVAMCGVSGVDVVQHLRRFRRFDHTRIIAMSGYVDKAHQVVCRDAGFDDFLAKPLELAPLELLLKSERDRVLRPRERSPAAALNDRYFTRRNVLSHGGATTEQGSRRLPRAR